MALRKPTAAAAAVNRLVREQAADVDAFLAAAAALRDAQLKETGDLESATERERELLEGLVRSGGDHVRQSLRAAAVDEEAARQLRQGRLESALEPRGFGTLLDQAKRTARKTEKNRPPQTKETRRPRRPEQASRSHSGACRSAGLDHATNSEAVLDRRTNCLPVQTG